MKTMAFSPSNGYFHLYKKPSINAIQIQFINHQNQNPSTKTQLFRSFSIKSSKTPLTPVTSPEPNTPPLVVVGSANADIYVEIDRLPREGETISAKNGQTLAGGKGANQAACGGKLSYPTYFVGQVGDDANGKLIIDALRNGGVHLDYVRHVGDVPTGHAVVMLQSDGQNSIIIVGGANNSGWPEELSDQHLGVVRNAGIILLQREIPDSVNIQVAKAAKNVGVPVILDVGGMDTPIPLELLKVVDILSPNESELARITGMPTENFEQIGHAVTKCHEMEHYKTMSSKRRIEASSSLSQDPDKPRSDAYEASVLRPHEDGLPLVTLNHIFLMPITQEHSKMVPHEVAKFYTKNHFSHPYLPKDYLFYQAILEATGSVIFSPLVRGEGEWAYNKFIIKRVFSQEDWGTDLFQTKELHQCRPRYFNYFDYMDAWSGALCYDNRQRKFSWFIAFNLAKEEWDFPLWFQEWFYNWGLFPIVMPHKIRTIYEQFCELNRTLTNPRLTFTVAYKIPWIIKWDYQIVIKKQLKWEDSKVEIPWLARRILLRWWDKKCEQHPWIYHHKSHFYNDLFELEQDAFQ